MYAEEANGDGRKEREGRERTREEGYMLRGGKMGGEQ